MADKWISEAIEHKGFLHTATHTPQNEKIPEKKIMKAEHSSNEHIRKAAHLADTLKNFHR